MFVERDAGLAAALRANLARLKQDTRGRVVVGDALDTVATLDGPFDLVFSTRRSPAISGPLRRSGSKPRACCAAMR